MTAQKQPVARKPFWIAVAAAGVFTIILSFPKRKATEPESQFENPQERAEELINGLIVRLGNDSGGPPGSTRSTATPAVPSRDLFGIVKEMPAPDPAPRSGAGPVVSRPDRADAMPALPVLGGLLVDGGRRLAILNGTAVGEGEAIGAFQVRTIEDDGVVLVWRGQTKRVRWTE